MGELLLGGWTMLAEGCAQCHVPLMRNPDGREDVCVGCGRRSRTGTGLSLEVEAAVPQSPDVGDRECIGVVELHEEEAALGASAGASTGVRGSSRVPARPGSPASMLADKMLAGWKMLGDHCPICRTPLCESKGGQVRCVSCDLEVRREGPGREQGVGDDGGDDGNDGDKGEDGGLKARRNRVVGLVLGYMEEVSGSLLGAPPGSGEPGGDALLRRLDVLDRCADIVSKLGSARI